MLYFSDPSFGWNAHKVEIALWTFCQANIMGISILAKKRENEDTEDKEIKKKKR